MSNWLPSRIDKFSSPYYEAVGLLSSIYVDIETAMQLIATSCAEPKNREKTVPFISKLGTISLYSAIKESAKAQYGDNNEIISHFEYACDAADSARIARNAFLHSSVNFKNDMELAVFSSTPDQKSSTGKNFKLNISQLRKACISSNDVRTYCFQVALWSAYPTPEKQKLMKDNGIRSVRTASLKKPPLVLNPKLASPKIRNS